jgi:hypothetical protein
MQLFSGSRVGMREREEFVRNGGVIYDGLININHPNNKRLYFVKRDIELIEDKMVVPEPAKQFDEDFKKKNIGGGEILRLSGLQRRTRLIRN